jgi:hypothetical protein
LQLAGFFQILGHDFVGGFFFLAGDGAAM